MVRKWIISLGGLGLVPAMPGTYASLFATAVFYALSRTVGSLVYPVIAGLVVVFAAISAALCPWAERHFNRRDPREFVLDEAVGQWITLLLVPVVELLCSPATLMADATAPLSATYIAAGFFLYRAFDVAKPFPIRNLEALPGASGVLLDDVVAAVYAALSLCVLAVVLQAFLGPDLYTPVT